MSVVCFTVKTNKRNNRYRGKFFIHVNQALQVCKDIIFNAYHFGFGLKSYDRHFTAIKIKQKSNLPLNSKGLIHNLSFFTFHLFQFDIFELKHMNKRAKRVVFLNTNWKETSV